MTNNTRDIYQQVTNQIIACIESGAGNCELPWHRNGVAHTRPTNILSGNAYRGVNIIGLWAAAEVRGFSTGIWGTYRQWQEKGAQVRKGEKSSLVVFYKQFDVEGSGEESCDNATDTRRMMARASWVFNADQVDGWTLPSAKVATNPIEALAQAEQFISATGANISHGGQNAYYHRGNDYIQMPDKTAFTGTETMSATQGYYAVLLHELTHWSGAQKRLDRTFGKRFGDDAYAMEEFVAELGAAFLCADLGITAQARPDHAAYIDHWMRVMKADKKAIFTAASKAAEAADYLAARHGEVRQEAA